MEAPRQTAAPSERSVNTGYAGVTAAVSEYQYYEFQALDRPLTKAEMAKLRSFSSRAQITPTSFVNEYNWGDFKGDPVKWMEKYFDAFLYVSNWGSRWLMLRLPKRSLDAETIAPYCAGESLSCHAHRDHLIVSFDLDSEGHEWVEGEGWLASLVGLRSDLIRGDHRSLYLGWLAALACCELDASEVEPPVPPGLGEPNGPLQSLVDFLEIDPDLISVAAEKSGKDSRPSLSEKEINSWLSKLPPKEKDALMAALLRDNNLYAGEELRQRALREIRGGQSNVADSQGRGTRRVAEMIAQAEAIGAARRKREAEARAKAKAKREEEEAEKRAAYLKAVAGKTENLWQQVEDLIATRQTNRYDQAVAILADLRDAAALTGRSDAFIEQMHGLQSRHAAKPSLQARLRNANLLL